MELTALIYIEGDIQAQRLVVAWPLVFAGTKPEESEIVRRWVSLSGVPLQHVRRLGAALRAHDICQPDGVVDPNALAYVKRVVSAKLPRRKEEV